MSGDDSDRDGPHVVIQALQTITPRTIRKSFALKFGLVLAVMALSIGGIGLAATQTLADQTQERSEQRFKSTAAQRADVVQNWIDNKKFTTRLYAANVDWSGNDTVGLTSGLAEIQTARDSIVNAHLIENSSLGPTVVASTGPNLKPGDTLSNTKRSWFPNNLQALEGLSSSGVYMSNTYEIGGQQVVGFVSKANVGIGQTRWLFLEISVFELRSALQAPGKRRTQVVNAKTNVIMVGSTANETLQIYAQDKTALKPIRKAQQLRNQEGKSAGVIAKMPANPAVIDEPYTIGYAPVPDTNWVVVVQSPRSAEFGFVQTISNWGLFATLAAVLLIGVTGTALGYSTSTTIDRLKRKTEEMREGNLDVDVHTTRIDNIGRLYEGFAEMRDALKEQIEEAERARKEAEVSRAEAVEMQNYLEEKAEEYSEIMQQCAAGDLTQRMSQDGENESMDTIASEFNDMIEELEKTTGQLKSYVDEVEEAGAEVEQSATTVRKASEQVADSIQKIAVDAEDQKERLQSISETMDDIADELETFAAEHPEADIEDQLDRIQDISGEINEIAELSEETQSETDNVSAAAEEQAAELNEVSERANDLQRYAQPLRDILDRFETEAEHEFVFSVGPTGSGGPAGGSEEEEE